MLILMHKQNERVSKMSCDFQISLNWGEFSTILPLSEKAKQAVQSKLGDGALSFNVKNKEIHKFFTWCLLNNYSVI